MSDTNTNLESFLAARKQAQDMESAAKKEFQVKYSALLSEAAVLQTQFKEIFSGRLELPKGIKTFTVDLASKAKKGPKKPAASEPAAAPVNGAKVGGLKRSLAAFVAKRDALLASNKPVPQDIADRLYELEDELKQLGVTVTRETPVPAAEENLANELAAGE